MARTRQIQRPPEIPRAVSTRGGTSRSKPALAMLTASVLAALWAVAMLTPLGRIVYVYIFVYLEYYLGPVTLVSLSLTVMIGLAATDRSVLMIRHRVLLQSSHRALGILAVGSLVVHIMTKVGAGRLNVVDALIPFISGRGLEGAYIGMGTVAAYLMVATLWTGIIRARFVGVGKPWMWRALHSTAYASWPFGMLHGLKAGRVAATWVTASYIACVLLVVVALLVRLSASIGRKRKEAAQTTGTLKPVGKPVQTGSESWSTLAGAARRIAGGRERSTREPRESRASLGGRLAPPDPLTDSWVRFGDSRKVDSPGQRSNRFAVPEVPLARATTERAVPEDPWDSPRRWSSGRSVPEDPRDSPQRRSDDERPAGYAPRYEPVEDRPAADSRETPRRRAARETPAAEIRRRSARYAEEDDAPVVETPRHGRSAPRYAEEDEAPVVQARRRTPRYADEDADEPVQTRRGRSARYAEEESARYVEEDEAPVDQGRRRTPRYAEEDEAPAVQARRRTPRYADAEEEEPEIRRRTARYTVDDSPLPDDDTPTLVDLASRRAKRAAADGGSSAGRSRKKKASADAVDEAYWRSLRGEAQ